MVNPIFVTTFVVLITYIVIEYGVYARRIGKGTELVDWKLPDVDLKEEKSKMNIPLYIHIGLFLLSFLLLIL